MRHIRIIILTLVALAVAALVLGTTHYSNIVTTSSSENDTLGGATVRVTGILSVGGAASVTGATSLSTLSTSGAATLASAGVTGALTGSTGSFTGTLTTTGGVRTDSIIRMRSGATYYGTSYGAMVIPMVNKSGSVIAAFSPVTVDSASQNVVAIVKVDAGPDTATEAFELETDGGYWRVVAKAYSIADACSIKITGTACAAIGGTPAVLTDTIALATNETTTASKYNVWTAIDTIVSYGTETNDSIEVAAYPYMAIATAGDNATMLAGVTMADSIIDNATGYVVVFGPARVHTTGAVVPGVNLQSVGSGKADAVASVTVGASLGHAMEAGTATDDTLWCFINHK